MTTFNSAEPIGLELKARLEKCTIAQGGETDIGRKVYLGRRHLDKSMNPCTVILEGLDEAARERTATNFKITQNYLIGAVLDCDIDNPNVAAHKALRDMKRAIFPTASRGGATLDGKVQQVDYVGREISPRPDGEASVYVVMQITVTYVEDLSNP